MPRTEKVATAEVWAGEKSLLDEVLDRTPATPTVPDGFTALAAGVVRKIRVSREWLQDPNNSRRKPFIVQVSEIDYQYDAVIFPAGCVMACAKTKTAGCGGDYFTGSAWVETDQALYVK